MIFQTKKIINKILRILGIILLCTSSINALETDTHEGINEYIARNTLNVFSLDSYLKNQLGIQNGVDEIVNSQKVWQWLRDGGLKEDIPAWHLKYLRSVNHFHNPITGHGFSGIWGSGFLEGDTAIVWSLKDSRTQQYGYYSWYDTRDYFYNALTASDKTTRDTNFAETFRGLGQLMHLVSDMSVPEHTRDDGHYLLYAFEDWVKENVNFNSRTGTIKVVNTNVTPVFYDMSVINTIHPSAIIPFTNLFDTSQYDGTNPNITTNKNCSITKNMCSTDADCPSDDICVSTIGLSEYSNANFLSPDSFFTSNFPYPNLGSVVEYDEPIAGKNRTYLRKLGQGEFDDDKIGNGEHIEHLALTGWLYKWLSADLKKKALKPVYSDYAQKLIPRAVGYSAGLLNYFFRGDIEAVDTMPIISSNGDTTHVTLKVKNNTPNETLGPGEGEEAELLVAYKYGLSGNEVYGVSNSVPFNEIIASGSESINVYTFSFADAIPSDAEAVTLTLVYRGKLGNEKNAVIAGTVKKGTFVVLQAGSGYAVFALNIIENTSYSLTPVEAVCYYQTQNFICKVLDGGVYQNVYAVDDIGISAYSTLPSQINNFDETYPNNIPGTTEAPTTRNTNEIYDLKISGINLEPYYAGEESNQDEIDKESFYTTFEDYPVTETSPGYFKLKGSELNSVGLFSYDVFGHFTKSQYPIQGKANEYGDFIFNYRWSYFKHKSFHTYEFGSYPFLRYITGYTELYNIESYFMFFKVGDIIQKINMGDIPSYKKSYPNIYTRDGIYKSLNNYYFTDNNLVYAGSKWVVEPGNQHHIGVFLGLINTDRDSSMPLGYWQEWEISDVNAEEFLGNWYGSFNYTTSATIGIYSAK